jgi:hypothetical protein
MSETPSLSADERAELERLRREVATLPTIWPRWPSAAAWNRLTPPVRSPTAGHDRRHEDHQALRHQ